MPIWAIEVLTAVVIFLFNFEKSDVASASCTAFSISDARSELYMANPSFMVCFVVVRNVLPYPRFCKDYSAKENGLQSEFNYYNQFIILPVIYENFLIRIAKPDRLCYSKERFLGKELRRGLKLFNLSIV